MSGDLFELVKGHRIEPLKQAISEANDFDINEFFNDNFMFWSVEDIDFLGKHFDISVDIRDNAALIKPSVLDYFLNACMKLDAETVEDLLTTGDEEKLEVLMKHGVSIPAESIFMWPVFNRENLLKVYLDNGGDPDICDEDGTSLIDAWYSQSGDCPAVAILEAHGAIKSADALTMKEKLAFIADFGRKMKDDPEFAEKVEQAATQIAKEQERTKKNDPDFQHLRPDLRHLRILDRKGQEHRLSKQANVHRVRSCPGQVPVGKQHAEKSPRAHLPQLQTLAHAARKMTGGTISKKLTASEGLPSIL